jgi:ribosome biogenesis GTPase / thiamine phosphate phosphatase
LSTESVVLLEDSRTVAKRKKVRVAFRKNRQNRKRENDVTRDFRGHDPKKADGVSGERIRAKGDLSRHRTIMAVDDTGADTTGDDASVASRLAVDLSECLEGRVIRIHGLESIVQDDEGNETRCGVRRVLKTLAIDGRNVVAVGDRVWFLPGAAGQGTIEKVEERRGTIKRGYRRREHIIVSNVDQLLIVASFEQPELKLPLIDRYLISAERGGVRPVIILNKADLVDVAEYQWVIGLYSQLGYETIPTSSADGRGVARLRQILKEGASAVSGQSGVGKSSLLNVIQPGLNLRVREVSDWTEKGKHTTTHAELLRLEGGGYVVDTPGLRQFELWAVDRQQIQEGFIEFRPYVTHCRFPDCSHTHERDCAVKDAVHFGQIDLGRFESYLKLYDEKPLEGE